MAFAIGRSKRKTCSFVSPGRRSVEDAKSSPKAMDSGKIVREEDGFLLRAESKLRMAVWGGARGLGGP